MRLLSEEEGDISSQSSDQEVALSKAVDVTVGSMETDSESLNSKKEKHREYEYACREKCSTAEMQSHSESVNLHLETQREMDSNMLGIEETSHGSSCKPDEKPTEEETTLSYQRKVTVLYLLLSACLADMPEDKEKCTRQRKGYDARHRVALRLLAAWLDIQWIKVVWILIISYQPTFSFLYDIICNNMIYFY